MHRPPSLRFMKSRLFVVDSLLFVVVSALTLQYAWAQNRFDINYAKREKEQKQNVLQRHPSIIHKYNPSYTGELPSKLPVYTDQDRKDATYWQTHENRAEYEGYDGSGDHNIHIQIDKDRYRYRPAAQVSTSGTDADYRMNMLVDPCRGHPSDCCYDVSGSPEYIKNLNDPKLQHTVNEENVRISLEASRLQDQEVYLDPTCIKNTTTGAFPRKDCMADR